ncbi:MAG TPA: membrane protein insertion efficiency factor YidD [Candidatus Marinimicrobia bacterium]|nr:membrane protein insertion efficiency factor YidD [Candidatus Neomarinimicrobiota bacterium]HIN62863.1 membrane protein insertion efficiency factor YidD [Candidatus Neomarinimicrobiota bacterium]
MPTSLKRFRLALCSCSRWAVRLPSIVLSLLARFLIQAYQFVFSPLFPSTCRFSLSCSNYALEAFQKHSPGKAMMLTLIRISNCHPWGTHGEDPVPD